MSQLNFHHLHYFWAVAKEGNLTRAAAHLHVSQSALSTQIRQLEQQVGQSLFVRTARSMQLTEAGRLALNYADSIFATGEELMSVLREGQAPDRQILRIGAVAMARRGWRAVAGGQAHASGGRPEHGAAVQWAGCVARRAARTLPVRAPHG